MRETQSHLASKVVGLSLWISQKRIMQNLLFSWGVCHVIVGWMKDGEDGIYDPWLVNTVARLKGRQITVSI